MASQNTIDSLTKNFISRLELPATKPETQTGIFVGGFPNSGKTTAAKEFARHTNSVHIQSNSARFLLADAGLSWGENVRLVVTAVLDHFLSRGYSIVLDGMFIGGAEQSVRAELIKKYRLKSFSVAVVCSLENARRRAYRRYSDNKQSSFEDWRVNPKKFDDWLGSMPERLQRLKELVLRDKSIWTLVNDGTIEETRASVRKLWPL